MKVTIKERDGHWYNHYRLCESYRDGQHIRNRTLLSLGDLEQELNSQQIHIFVRRLNELYRGEKTRILSAFRDEKTENLALYYCKALKEAEAALKSERKARGIETVDLNSFHNKDIREMGAEWLCLQACEQLQLSACFSSRGWNQDDIRIALTHIVSRAVYPVSELKTVSWIKENSSLSELTGMDAGQLTKDRLYQISHRLYKEKQGLESYLSRRTNELFELEDKIILYDLTNTYFEGRMKDSKLCRFGRSKEKRSDARIVVLAAVVNPEGFLKETEIFEGNLSDPSSLKPVLDKLKAYRDKTSKTKQVVVMDAGIATEANLRMLREESFDYLCVSRKKLKEYQVVREYPVLMEDKRHQPIEIREIEVEGETDCFFRVKSQAKQAKELSMETRFTEAFEKSMEQIRLSLNKKGGVKKAEKVWERIGRLKQKYPSVNRLYEMEVKSDKKGIATEVLYARKPVIKPESQGIYFLRTSLSASDEKTIWQIYNTIREIESTYRCLKTDLNLRPVFHKTDDATMAHLHLGLLAYWVVDTIRYQLKEKGFRSHWREIVRIMNTQKIVTTSMRNTDDEHISIRQCSEPNDKVKLLYDLIGYR
ncbi:transposase [Bacteroidia bacterium]|nr:transposase [Bacteroidia bacterium]